ncbi:sensor histidine kinase [Mesobacillus maritimus]|uniref:histidine kinase n=1 Tax=Mesobacillus maritimus TaxID=1643336 RepID=A0ABS7K3D6_9BACI|nr:ATP-binding protein [Mesobacillus maritimus]MBY0096713.1 HAMP domain-containing protein [Mesobacillus maritimus]
MKRLADSLLKKLWLTITIAVLITISVSFILSYLFYEKLYVDRVEENLLETGELLAQDYQGGPLSENLKAQIKWFNEKSEMEVFLIQSSGELSSCLPFETKDDALFPSQDLAQLEQGQSIEKIGFEKLFGRKIIAVIIPLLSGDDLEGMIFLYVPLAKISEITKDFSYLWLIGGVAFIVVALILGFIMIDRLTRPLVDMKRAAKRVAKGDYSTRVVIHSNDEVGQLAAAFNQMSASIQLEDERKREFLADVSHELRTPISYIKGYSEGLVSSVINNSQEQVKYLKLINREAGRMGKLVSDLLDLSKIDAGQFTLDRHPFPLAQLIEDFVQKYSQVLTEKRITLVVHLDPDIIIDADEGKMEQILQNIMDNAVRYTDPAGKIGIRLEKHPYGARVEISDSGIGIPAEDLLKITERFYRVNKARSRSNGGTGLGLAIAEKLIALHSGKIEIESELGKGTTVRLLFRVM